MAKLCVYTYIYVISVDNGVRFCCSGLYRRSMFRISCSSNISNILRLLEKSSRVRHCFLPSVKFVSSPLSVLSPYSEESYRRCSDSVSEILVTKNGTCFRVLCTVLLTLLFLHSWGTCQVYKHSLDHWLVSRTAAVSREASKLRLKLDGTLFGVTTCVCFHTSGLYGLIGLRNTVVSRKEVWQWSLKFTTMLLYTHQLACARCLPL